LAILREVEFNDSQEEHMAGTQIDYRALLKKLMDCVSNAEGVYFYPDEPNGDFTQEEISELNAIAFEIAAADKLARDATQSATAAINEVYDSARQSARDVLYQATDASVSNLRKGN
jgi:hypothetical protein